MTTTSTTNVSALSARLSELPDPLPDELVPPLVELLAGCGAALAAAAVTAGQRDRAAIIRDTAVDLMSRRPRR